MISFEDMDLIIIYYITLFSATGNDFVSKQNIKSIFAMRPKVCLWFVEIISVILFYSLYSALKSFVVGEFINEIQILLPVLLPPLLNYYYGT